MKDRPAPLPTISPALIEYLENVYPDKAPLPHETLDDIRYSSGQVSVVRHLKFLKEQQENNILETV